MLDFLRLIAPCLCFGLIAVSCSLMDFDRAEKTSGENAEMDEKPSDVFRKPQF